jgi:outer membrane protein X
MAANAQEKGNMAVGGNLVLFSGVGAKFQYNLTNPLRLFNVAKPLRLEGSFTYFPDNNFSSWDLSANGHWLFTVADKITVYPLAGLGILNGSGYSDFFVNIGGGVDYTLTDKLILNAELKYKISNWDDWQVSAGLAYRF